MRCRLSVSHLSVASCLSWPEFSTMSMDVVEADGSVALSEEPGRRRRVHGMLKLYYGLNEEGKAPDHPQSLDPCDINGPHFDPELYLNKVLVTSNTIT